MASNPLPLSPLYLFPLSSSLRKLKSELFPSLLRKTQVAKKLGLQPRQVAVWFQNRRARWKTKLLERDYDQLKSAYDSLVSNYDSILEDNEKLKAEDTLKLHIVGSGDREGIWLVVSLRGSFVSAVAAPPVAAALAAATSIPLGSMGKWIDSLMKNYEDAVKAQKDILTSINVGTYLTIKDLDSIMGLWQTISCRGME